MRLLNLHLPAELTGTCALPTTAWQVNILQASCSVTDPYKSLTGRLAAACDLPQAAVLHACRLPTSLGPASVRMIATACLWSVTGSLQFALKHANKESQPT